MPVGGVEIEGASFAPLLELSDFLAHEEELFAGVSVLVGVQQAEIGELLPHVAGHFVEKRALSVNDFVVREGKKEILGEGVEQRGGEVVVLVLAMDGVVGKVFYRVVHPT